MGQKVILLFRANNGNTLYSWNGRQVTAIDNEEGQTTDQDLLCDGSNKLESADEVTLDNVASSRRTKVFKLRSSNRKQFEVIERVYWDLY